MPLWHFQQLDLCLHYQSKALVQEAKMNDFYYLYSDTSANKDDSFRNHIR